jgi:diguanylate cyclase (GGDEF)-like protein
MKHDRLEHNKIFRFLLLHFGRYDQDPSLQELEVLNEIQGRVKLVIKARWIMLLLLFGYGIFAGAFFLSTGISEFQDYRIFIILLVYFTLVAYNTTLHIYHRELCHLRFTPHLQVLLDIYFITILIHLTGGSVSWLWTIYLLATLEAAFLLERRRAVWLVGAAGGLMYGALLVAEFEGFLPQHSMPFVDLSLTRQFGYVMLLWLWVSIMNGTVAIIAAYLMQTIRKREHDLKLLVVKDQMTNLYNRGYFFRMLNSEIQRSARYGRVFSIILLDLDDFKHYNDTYGHLEGDELLKEVAHIFRKNVRRSEKSPAYDIDIPCRYGGEEFAIILPETPATPERFSADQDGISAFAFAERIRKDIESLQFSGQHVTISIGIASFPAQGSSPDDLVKAADDALYQAKREGKNRVVIATAAVLNQEIQ